ncbi:MAG: glycosyltransferase [Candidatus Dependentiae bacterium]|nr:glycosyltransferase [Candidatus Dependentiae bacterium]
MTKIQLLHVTSSLKVGGAETLLCDLINTMDGQKFEHHVIYFHDGPHSDCLKKAGVPTYHIKGAIALYDPIFFKRLYTTIKKINPDCMHTQLWAANNTGRVIARMLNIPIVCALHNKVSQDGFLRNSIDRCTTRFADAFIAISPNVATSLTTRSTWISPARITIIPNGVDGALLHTKAAHENVERASLGLTPEHFVIGSVGRFVPIKQYDIMLKAFALVHQQAPHARLMLVGLGPLEQQLRQQAQELGISAQVIFIIDQPAYRYYPLFDCFSLAYNQEGISVALLEAMSFNLPCVIADVDPTHMVLKHEFNGLLIPTATPQALAQNYLRLIQDPGLSQQLGIHARDTVENNFSFKKMLHAYEALFQETVQCH